MEKIAKDHLNQGEIKILNIEEYAAKKKILRSLIKKQTNEKPFLQVAFVAIQTYMIDEDTEEKYADLFKSIMEDKSINSVVLRIDSPGGVCIDSILLNFRILQVQILFIIILMN